MGPDDFSQAPQPFPGTQLPQQPQAPQGAGLLTPEQINALMALSANPEQKMLLERRLAMAQALKNKAAHQQYSTPAGALFGSIANIINEHKGRGMEETATQDYQGILGNEAKTREPYMRALLEAMSKQPAQSQPGADTGTQSDLLKYFMGGEL